MKWIRILMTAAVLVGYCTAQVSPDVPKAAGFSINVVPPATPVTLASPLTIQIIVKNTGPKEIWWRSEFGDTPYKAFRVLLTRGGHEAETTFFHRKITGRQRATDPSEVAGGGSIVFQVAPGKSLTYTLDLKRLYQITEPGEYSLQVSRYDETSKTTVRSNLVTMKIEP